MNLLLTREHFTCLKCTKLLYTLIALLHVTISAYLCKSSILLMNFSFNPVCTNYTKSVPQKYTLYIYIVRPMSIPVDEMIVCSPMIRGCEFDFH